MKDPSMTVRSSVELVYSNQQDLLIQPLKQPDLEFMWMAAAT